MRKLIWPRRESRTRKGVGRRLDRNCITTRKSKTPNLRKPQRILRRAKREKADKTPSKKTKNADPENPDPRTPDPRTRSCPRTRSRPELPPAHLHPPNPQTLSHLRRKTTFLKTSRTPTRPYHASYIRNCWRYYGIYELAPNYFRQGKDPSPASTMKDYTARTESPYWRWGHATTSYPHSWITPPPLET
jgi:hypothetical protein